MIENLVKFIKDQGYENVRVLKDQTIVGTIELLFTSAICIDLDRFGYGKRFCFEDRDLAIAELNKLKTGDDEPTGYIARRNR